MFNLEDEIDKWIELGCQDTNENISHGKLKMPTKESMKAEAWDKFIQAIKISTKKDMMLRGTLIDYENNKNYEVTVKEIN